MMETLHVSHISSLQLDVRKGFNTKWLFDFEGCPECGINTKVEIKPPSMPVVTACEHFRGPEKKAGKAEDVWILNYEIPDRKKKKTPAAEPGESNHCIKPHPHAGSCKLQHPEKCPDCKYESSDPQKLLIHGDKCPGKKKTEKSPRIGEQKPDSVNRDIKGPEKPPESVNAYKGYHGNKLRDAKNIFFLEKCSQKIPTYEMLPKTRKCPKCGKKLEITGSSWDDRTYNHVSRIDCSYSETIFIAPSSELKGGLDHEWYIKMGKDPWAARIWGREGSIRPENFLKLLDLDLKEMGDLYSSRETKVHENAPVSTKKAPKDSNRPYHPIKAGKKGSTMVGMRKGSIYSFSLSKALNQPKWTIEFNYTKSGGMYEVGEKLELDHWSGIFSAMVTLIHNAGPILKEKKLPLPTLENTYINQHAWPEWALEDKFVYDTLKSAYKAVEMQKKHQAEGEKKAQPEPQKKQQIYMAEVTFSSNRMGPKKLISVTPLPVPESRKRKRKPVYHNPNSRQEDLFKFFPQNQASVDEWFEMERGGATVSIPRRKL